VEDSSGPEASALKNQLLENGRQFNFFQAVTLLENSHSGPKLGGQGPVAEESLRFRGHPSLAFPAGDIERISSNALGQIEVESNFVGLYGPASPLPAYITEAVIAEQNRIESEDHTEFFLETESDVRALRDNRLNISELAPRTASIRGQLRDNQLTAKQLDNLSLDMIRQGVNLSELLSEEELESFRNRQLVLMAYELPAARQRDFFDLFNHRLTSLLYRGWRKYRPELHYKAEAQDDFSNWLFALMGAPTAEERNASAIQWPRLLGYLGLIAMQSRSVNVLCAVVSGYFDGVEVEIEEYVERWASIPLDQQCRLGRSNSVLGLSVSVGQRVKDHSGKFRIKIGPLSYAQFLRFLPEGEDYPALLELVQYLMPEHLCFDFELILKGDEVPALQLGKAEASLLGWSSWLGDTRGENQSVILRGLD